MQCQEGLLLKQQAAKWYLCMILQDFQICSCEGRTPDFHVSGIIHQE